jgi:sRNA-binding protein
MDQRVKKPSRRERLRGDYFLFTRFPNAFNEKYPRPFLEGTWGKVRDAVRGDPNADIILKAFERYTESEKYLKTIREGAKYIGLNGKETGHTVSKSEADSAAYDRSWIGYEEPEWECLQSSVPWK